MGMESNPMDRPDPAKRIEDVAKAQEMVTAENTFRNAPPTEAGINEGELAAKITEVVYDAKKQAGGMNDTELQSLISQTEEALGNLNKADDRVNARITANKLQELRLIKENRGIDKARESALKAYYK